MGGEGWAAGALDMRGPLKTIRLEQSVKKGNECQSERRVADLPLGANVAPHLQRAELQRKRNKLECGYHRGPKEYSSAATPLADDDDDSGDDRDVSSSSSSGPARLVVMCKVLECFE